MHFPFLVIGREPTECPANNCLCSVHGLYHLCVCFSVNNVLPMGNCNQALLWKMGDRFPEAPSTLIRFQTKTELFCSGYGYCPHYNAENDHRKRSHSKTLSRVERFENDAFWKCCFLMWTKKAMISENGDIIKIDTTGRQTTRPWVSKMANRRYHVASLLIGVVVWTGENDTKTKSVDANLFENEAKRISVGRA